MSLSAPLRCSLGPTALGPSVLGAATAAVAQRTASLPLSPLGPRAPLGFEYGPYAPATPSKIQQDVAASASSAWRRDGDDVGGGAAPVRATPDDARRMASLTPTPVSATPESISADCSLVDELDLDLWEGQFEFVGPDFPGAGGRGEDGERADDTDDVITPAMVRRARAGRVVDVGGMDVDAQQWCDHLADQVQMLQQQVGVLADNQTSTDERYTRAKQDNAALQARVLMLEEQLRETELRAEERLQAEQKRHRELMVRVEREKQLELENCAIRLQTVELEAASLRDESSRLRQQSDQLRAERLRVQEALVDSESALAALRDEVAQQKDDFRQREAEHQQREQLVEELSLEVERLREAERCHRQSSRERDPDQAAQVLALSAQLERVREEARSLRDANEELQAMVLTRGVEEGRSLLTGSMGMGSSSLAAELEAMSQDESMDKALDQSSVAKIRQALKEQQEMNSQLRQYIDGILINIIENYPELLEVRKS